MEHQPIEILLIEDNPGDACLIREALSWGSTPKRTNIVTNGEDALRYLHRLDEYRSVVRPDFILLDLTLPRVDGRQVLEDIKDHPDLRHIPVVVLSTSTSRRDVLSSYEHHANCYLTKPASLDQFLDMVQEIESYWLRQVALPAL